MGRVRVVVDEGAGGAEEGEREGLMEGQRKVTRESGGVGVTGRAKKVEECEGKKKGEEEPESLEERQRWVEEIY